MWHVKGGSCAENMVAERNALTFNVFQDLIRYEVVFASCARTASEI